jgi:L-lactate dehydrogenase complex protein LldE
VIGVERPARVALFVTCLVDLLYPEVGDASVALLEREGVTVEVPAAQTCCGQPPFNSGFHDDARRLARTMLEAFEDADAVVTPSGSCAAMVRSYYPHLFDGHAEHARAVALAAKTFELSEFIVDVLDVRKVPGAWRGRVTYHDSCHGLRELGLRGQGRRPARTCAAASAGRSPCASRTWPRPWPTTRSIRPKPPARRSCSPATPAV